MCDLTNVVSPFGPKWAVNHFCFLATPSVLLWLLLGHVSWCTHTHTHSLLCVNTQQCESWTEGDMISASIYAGPTAMSPFSQGRTRACHSLCLELALPRSLFSSSGECDDHSMLWYRWCWPSFQLFIDNVAILLWSAGPFVQFFEFDCLYFFLLNCRCFCFTLDIQPFLNIRLVNVFFLCRLVFSSLSGVFDE